MSWVIGARSHGEIVELAEQVEEDNGFMWRGDDILVRGAEVVGEDRVNLLLNLWKRACE